MRYVPLAIALGILAGNAAHAAPFKVVGPTGEGVAGARVAVYGPPLAQTLSGRSTSGPLELRSADDGSVPGSLPAVTPRLVFVDHPEFAPRFLVGAETGAIRLESGAMLAGRVRGVRGNALTGRVCVRWNVTVDGWGRRIPVERCAPVAADGQFQLPGLGEQTVSIEITAAAHLPARLSWQPGKPPVEVRLDAGSLLRGRIQDPMGQAVVGAEVTAQGASPATSDRDGNFEIAVAALPIALQLSADGLRTRRVTVESEPRSDAPAFRMDWGQQLTGSLRLADGGTPERPVVVAERFVPSRGWDTSRLPLTLDEAGSFRVQLERPGRYRLRLKAVGYREEALPELEVTTGSVIDLGPVSLNRGAGFHCRVIDESSGDPVAGAEVRLIAQGSAVFEQIHRRAAWSAVSAADGTAAVWGLEEGRYEVRVRRDGYATGTANIEVFADRLTAGDDVPLGPGIELVGEVRGRSGSPVATARIQLFDSAGLGLVPIAETTTDGLGAFRQLVVAAGEYSVRLQGPRQSATQTLRVEAGEPRQRVDLTLPGVRLELHLLEGGEPVPAGTTVGLTAGLDPGLKQGKVIVQGTGELSGQVERLGIPEPPLTAQVGENGWVVLDEVAVGPARLEVIPLDGRPPIARALAVPDVARHAAEIELASPALAGQLTVDDGTSPPRAVVRLFDTHGFELASAESSGEGNFSFMGLAAGRYALSVEAEGFAAVTLADVDVPPEGRSVDLTLERAHEGAIEVFLARAEGGAMATTSLVLLGEVGGMVRASWTDAEGRARFERLPPGKYDLVWTDAVVGSGAAAGIRVNEGESTTVERVVANGGEIGLTCPPERCAGRTVEELWLINSEGVELSAFLNGAVTQRQFGSDGTLRLGRLSAGVYRLLSRGGGAFWQQQVVVAGGREVVVAALPSTSTEAPASP